jgi:methylase of polypeptide subunit release factors
MTVRRQHECVLDLCCGGGIQGLLAARHASHVTGTDINPRARDFVTLNAGLNGLDNLEFRQGRQYEPVQGERFALVIANPPYVISPASTYAYRDSGLAGDSFSEQIIRAAPKYLNENGYCSVIFNWYHSGTKDSDDEWANRVLQWVEGNGCDSWLIRFESQEPREYAVSWLEPEERTLKADEYERLFDEWLNYYERSGIGAISMGVLVMRRRSTTRNWVRLESSLHGWHKRDCSEPILRIFAAEDLLQEVDSDPQTLLGCRFALADDHELAQSMRMENGGWVINSALLKQTNGFGFSGRVDPNVMMLLASCDGRRTLGEELTQMAAHLGVQPEQVTEKATSVVRSLIRAGFLINSGLAPDRSDHSA